MKLLDRFFPLGILLLLASVVPSYAMGAPESGYSPTASIELIVPASEGGGSDIFAKAIADTIGESDLMPVDLIVDQKPGGSGAAAIAYVNSRPHPDHTLIVVNSSHILRMFVNSDSMELRPIARLAVDPILLVVSADSPFETFGDFSREAVGRRMMVGTADVLDRYCVMRLNREIGGDLRSIYYNGASFIEHGLVHGLLDGGIMNPSEAKEGLSAGRIRILATFSELSPSRFIPPVESFSQMGYTGLEFQSSRYVMGPIGMGEEAIAYWSGVFRELSLSDRWNERYIEGRNVRSAYLDMKQAEAFLADTEIPWVKQIIAEGLVD